MKSMFNRSSYLILIFAFFLQGCWGKSSSSQVSIQFPHLPSSMVSQNNKKISQKSGTSKADELIPSFFDAHQKWAGNLVISDGPSVGCYMVFVGGPEKEMKTSQCVDSIGGTHNFGQFVGMKSAGESVELEILSGPNRKITLVGLSIAEGHSCEDANVVNPETIQYSQPKILGSTTVDLNEGQQNVQIPLDGNLSLPDLVSCTGPALPFYDSIEGDRAGALVIAMSYQDNIQLSEKIGKSDEGIFAIKPLKVELSEFSLDPANGGEGTFTMGHLVSGESPHLLSLPPISGNNFETLFDSYISPVIDAGAPIDWSRLNFQMIPATPLGKPFFPGNEEGYGAGDMDWSFGEESNISYWSFDELDSGNSTYLKSHRNEPWEFSSNDSAVTQPQFSDEGGVLDGRFLDLASTQGITSFEVLPPFDNNVGAVSFWIQITDDTNLEDYLFQYGDLRLKIVDFGSGYIKIRLLEENSPIIDSTNKMLRQPGWFHVAVSWNKKNVVSTVDKTYDFKISLDGKVITQNSYPALTNNLNIVPNTRFVLGGRSNSSDGTYDSNSRFDGHIDDVLMIAADITEDQVKQLHLRGNSQLRFNSRACRDTDCSVDPATSTATNADGTETFKGISGNDYFGEYSNFTNEPPIFEMTDSAEFTQGDENSPLTASRYFQYRLGLAYGGDDKSPLQPSLTDFKINSIKGLTSTKIYWAQATEMIWDVGISYKSIQAIEGLFVEEGKEDLGSGGLITFQVATGANSSGAADSDSQWLTYDSDAQSWVPASEDHEGVSILEASNPSIMGRIPRGPHLRVRFLLKSKDGYGTPAMSDVKLKYIN